MNFSGMNLGCRRAYVEGRAFNKRKHHHRKTAQGPPPPPAGGSPPPPPPPAHNQAPPPPPPPAQNNKTTVTDNKTNVSSTSNANTQNSNNNTNNSKSKTVNKQKNNTADQSNNNGVIVGSGNTCRRAFIEVEMEARELDTGSSVLAAMGGLTARDFDDDMEMLATRDLGRMAETLGVRAVGHDGDDDAFTHYKRDVGTECVTGECAMMKREVDEMLRQHARSLGYWV